jgi:hypothetical protein
MNPRPLQARPAPGPRHDRARRAGRVESASRITIDAMRGNKVQRQFQEPAERGDTVTNKLYSVVKSGDGETSITYT